MSDFETNAELSLTVPPRELRNVRQQIESGIGTVEVGMTDGGAMSAQAARGGGAGGGSRERRWRRREHRWARENNENLDDAVAYLEDIEDKVGSDGATGGIFGTLLDLGGEAGGAVGSAVGTAGATAIGSAVGSAVGNALTGATVEVKKPQWVPLAVEDTDALAVEETAPLAVEDPSPLDVSDPSPLDVTDPSPLTVDDPSPLRVEAVDPLPVQREPQPVEPPDRTPRPNPPPLPTTPPTGGGGSTSPPNNTGDGGVVLGEYIRQQVEKVPVVGEPLANLDRKYSTDDPGLGPIDPVRVPKDTSPFELLPGPLGPLRGAADELSSGSNTPSGRSTGARTVTVDQQNDIRFGDIVIDAEVDQNLDRELDRLEKDILDEVDDRIADAIDDFEQEITQGRR